MSDERKFEEVPEKGYEDLPKDDDEVEAHRFEDLDKGIEELPEREYEETP